ncbi:MmcQ/YjbR family DNA-binding protein [Acinetobacter sp. UBA6720]|uniref:MmcQ/YjbR family DNA-binding protein n=1 Tax=Acinetobacter sp. UBA6720 TaxID=1945953 RepID=UPI0025BF18B1|nr:MmcQ/YjbR family DNA-binding protein [Acinetobacter sp. UBA6720]
MTLHKLVASFALHLPEVTCSQPFGEGCDVYKVMDKMFLLNSSLKGVALSNLKVKPDHGAMLRDIYPYIHAGWHMNKKHWISIYEDENVDPDLVIDLVHSSYELVVSKLNKRQKQRIAALQAIT